MRFPPNPPGPILLTCEGDPLDGQQGVVKPGTQGGVIEFAAVGEKAAIVAMGDYAGTYRQQNQPNPPPPAFWILFNNDGTAVVNRPDLSRDASWSYVT